MSLNRIFMVVLALIVLFCFIGMGAVSEKSKTDRSFQNLMGVLGLIMALATIVNVFFSYRYAWRAGLQAGLWAVGALLLPFIVPFVLAFYREKPSEIEDTETAGSVSGDEKPFEMEEKVQKISIKEGLTGSSEWNFEDIRLYCFVVPSGFKWRVVSSTQETSYLFPDTMDEEVALEFYRMLEQFISGKNKNMLSGVKIILIDYNNRGSAYELRKLKNAKSLLAGLYNYRETRKERLDKWLEGNPSVTLTGGLGSKATIDKDGFHLKKISLAWPDVARITSETTYGLSCIFVLPEERSGGIFDLKRAKYSLARVPAKKNEIYSAELFFWKIVFGAKAQG